MSVTEQWKAAIRQGLGDSESLPFFLPTRFPVFTPSQ